MKKPKQTADLPTSPLSLLCPFCKAKPGNDCATSEGGLSVVHVMRVKAAAKADKRKALKNSI